jgi:hypothetical protein
MSELRESLVLGVQTVDSLERPQQRTGRMIRRLRRHLQQGRCRRFPAAIDVMTR